MSGGLKFDGDKPRYDLLPWEALEEVSHVMAFGAKKYAEENWRKGLTWKQLARATIGHTVQFLLGNDTDSESKRPHLAHAGASVLMLLSLVLNGRGTDNRFVGDPELVANHESAPRWHWGDGPLSDRNAACATDECDLTTTTKLSQVNCPDCLEVLGHRMS